MGDETPWGVAAELSRLLPGTATATYTGEAAATAGTPALIGGLLDAAAGRRIVAVVRDVHRHPWMADALRALLGARPDTAVVEMGVPQSPPLGAPHLATHGAARVCGQAAAETLTGQGPAPEAVTPIAAPPGERYGVAGAPRGAARPRRTASAP